MRPPARRSSPRAGCGGCHTLKAAGSSGNVGPNLDQLNPNFKAVHDQVEHGGGGMPAFNGQLSEQQIANVAAYVSTRRRLTTAPEMRNPPGGGAGIAAVTSVAGWGSQGGAGKRILQEDGTPCHRPEG